MDLIKNLTGKDPKLYEPVAEQIINLPDIDLFKELVEKDDFLFDFIKRNVSQRLSKACNKNNFKNLYKFLNVYSPYYDEFITSTLAQFSDTDVENKMLEYLAGGTISEKTYAAGYFSYVKNEKALMHLRKYAYSENDDLANNSSRALAYINDLISYNNAIEKLNSDDDFEQYSAIKFLTKFDKTDVLEKIFPVMKNSSLVENIAAEITNLVSLNFMLNTDYNDEAILAFCYILSGLAEVLPLSQIVDFELYSFIDNLLKLTPTGPVAVALLYAKEIFNSLVENDEYLYDEDKNTKNEIQDINILLNSIDINKYNSFLYEELYEDSDFIYFALDLTKDETMLSELLTGKNQTVVMKVLSILKSIGKLTEEYKQKGLNSLIDENLKSIVNAL